jgi:hypothetical protein
MHVRTEILKNNTEQSDGEGEIVSDRKVEGEDLQRVIAMERSFPHTESGDTNDNSTLVCFECQKVSALKKLHYCMACNQALCQACITLFHEKKRDHNCTVEESNIKGYDEIVSFYSLNNDRMTSLKV